MRSTGSGGIFATQASLRRIASGIPTISSTTIHNHECHRNSIAPRSDNRVFFLPQRSPGLSRCCFAETFFSIFRLQTTAQQNLNPTIPKLRRGLIRMERLSCISRSICSGRGICARRRLCRPDGVVVVKWTMISDKVVFSPTDSEFMMTSPYFQS